MQDQAALERRRKFGVGRLFSTFSSREMEASGGLSKSISDYVLGSLEHPEMNLMRKLSLTTDLDSQSTLDRQSVASTSSPMRRKRPTRRRHRNVHLNPASWSRHFSLGRSRADVQEEKAMTAAPTLPIEATKLVQYVQERRKKKILFKGEFLMIKKSTEPHRCEFGSMKENAEKNQYPELLPYDYNRVVLNCLPGQQHSHYINASYVDGHRRPKAYVVTQAVKSKPACVDFWRMVWELGSNCIVMLTKVFDFMRVMCLQYWPLTRFAFGDVEVETLETRTYAHFVIRTLKICKVESGCEPRIVKHFHFTEWELDSFPYISAFLELRRRVRLFTIENPCDAPLVIHCSNGGGRSGAFIAVDANLTMVWKEKVTDLFEFCKKINNMRQGLIESVDQYIFIYDVLCEAIQCTVEPYTMANIQHRTAAFKSKKDRQDLEAQDTHEYKLLNQLSPSLRIGDCAGGHRLENRGKNRDVMVVPPDHSRPYLSTLHGESKDYTYINAVYVDGFTRKSEWIVTEWPKHSTVDSFWALVFDHNSHTIVNLSNQSQNHKTYPPFIHNKGRQVYGPFVVEVLNFHSYPSMTSHMVKIMKRKATINMDALMKGKRRNDDGNAEKAQVDQLTFMISEIMASGGNAIQEAETRVCCIISVRMWPIENKVPLSTSGLVDVIKMVRSWRRRAPDRPETKPTMIVSHNGVSRCGIFIGANVCIDQMDMDGELDVFHAVKLIRINRPQLIDTKDEYKYLYDLMLHWYMTNPEYRNLTQMENHV